VRLKSGDVITGVSESPLETGSAALVGMRPERTVIGEAAQAVDNRFTAKVREAYFLGDHLRLRLSCLGDCEMMVKVPPIDTALPMVDEQITVGWAARHCRILME
jgi:putative spermidine/putrescine transport system ATP-binding protein